MIYTCPMHPEIKQEGPGECPICGMALEPLSIASDNSGDMEHIHENKELSDFKKRFVIGLIFTIPILILEMGGMIFNIKELIPPQTSNYIQMILSLPVVLWSGLPFFKRARSSIIMKSPNMFTLIAMGTGVALLYSIFVTLFPFVLPDHFKSNGGAAAVYFEAASVITVLVLLGQILEISAREKTSSAIRSLLKLKPKQANLLQMDKDGKEIITKINIEDVKEGDILKILPGEKIPVDGKVVDGESYVDESMITGEPIPVLKTNGEKVIAGTINGNGTLTMRAEKVGKDTVLANIIKLVESAQRSRAPIQKLADVVSYWFVPIVIVVATLSFVTWYFLGGENGFSYGLITAVSVLIIACPCAIGLATPMSIMVGVGKGAKSGILIKNAEALETLEKIDTILVDKTGTLTEGRPVVQDIVTFDSANINRQELLQICASLEQSSEHPLAKAITNKAINENLSLLKATEFNSITGGGISGVIEGYKKKDDLKVIIGSLKLMREQGVKISKKAQEILDKNKESGKTIVLIAINNNLSGFISITDKIRDDANDVIRKLHQMNIKVVMITGDNENSAHMVANKVGIKEFIANISPEEKYKIVKKFKAQGANVAMTGDGINDAPALSEADVGIAMGNGTDVAIESADVVLLSSDIGKLYSALRLSRITMNNIRQNLFLSFVYNALGVPIAAGVLYPIFGIFLSPIIAAAAMSLSSLSVIINSLRLNIQKL